MEPTGAIARDLEEHIDVYLAYWLDAAARAEAGMSAGEAAYFTLLHAGLLARGAAFAAADARPEIAARGAEIVRDACAFIDGMELRAEAERILGDEDADEDDLDRLAWILEDFDGMHAALTAADHLAGADRDLKARLSQAWMRFGRVEQALLRGIATVANVNATVAARAGALGHTVEPDSTWWLVPDLADRYAASLDAVDPVAAAAKALRPTPIQLLLLRLFEGAAALLAPAHRPTHVLAAADSGDWLHGTILGVPGSQVALRPAGEGTLLAHFELGKAQHRVEGGQVALVDSGRERGSWPIKNGEARIAWGGDQAMPAVGARLDVHDASGKRIGTVELPPRAD